MALDTKYRPTRYQDVLGQDALIQVCLQFVREDKGFHQSYIFAGQHGSGKTTTGRILARALLCEDPQDGHPCDKCLSCRSILEKGTSENYVELDAATKSGKEHINRIVEDLDYSTLTGRRRIYLFDEAHQLSKQALDALLKPMEDEIPGSQEKRLVCIFCTTEPEKMKNTIFSRCAPAFTIRVVSPQVIADRLGTICGKEGIEFEPEALVTIAEFTECHIRDALKTVEGVSMLGPVTRDSVSEYLRLGVNKTILVILALIGRDLPKAIVNVEHLYKLVSPTTAYERLAQASMMAYKAFLGVGNAPAYWGPEWVQKIGNYHQNYLLEFASTFASRPKNPSTEMLALDVARLHAIRTGQIALTTSVSVPVGSGSPPIGTSATTGGNPDQAVGKITSTPQNGTEGSGAVTERTTAWETPTGVYVDPRAINKRNRSDRKTGNQPQGLDPAFFRAALSERVEELKADVGSRGGSKG